MSVISMIPYKASGNIYTELLYQALESVNVRYQQIPFSLLYLLRHPPSEQHHYLHFHWPETFFVIRPLEPHKLFGAKGFIKLKLFWLLAKWRGYKIIWTVHEVDPHDLQENTRIHAFSRRLLWRLADVVFAHAPQVLADAERRWGHKKHVFTLPIGSYEGAYPAEQSQETARARLGIPPEAYCFVFFGAVRPYKGISRLLEAFRNVQQAHPATHLILAGRPISEDYAQEIKSVASGIANTHVVLEYVPDDEVQIYLRAADCFVAPYDYIQTCSAIYLALAFRLPIIIKAEGNVLDFADRELGIFMQDSDEIESAMHRVMELPRAKQEELRENAGQASRLFAWNLIKLDYRKAFDEVERESAVGRQE